MKAKGLPNRPRPSGQTVPILHNSRSAPLWLLRLCVLQRRFSVVTFLLVAAMLAVYGWTAYSQQMWSQSYRKLETLKRQERQLTTANEVLKNKIAEQAEQPAMSLTPPNPATAIFLVPAPERPVHAAEPVLSVIKPAQTEQPTPLPLGY